MAAADFQIDEGGPGLTLRLTGDWTATELGRVSRRLDEELLERRVEAVDLTELGRFDTAGALAIVKAANCVLPPTAWSQRPEAGRTYALVEKLERESADPPRRSSGWVLGFAKVGRGVDDIWAEATLSMAFLGRLIVAVGAALRHPGAIRWPAWFSQAERSGLDAIPIITVTNFFIGAVIAFLGANLLTQFGAGVFTVQLVAVAVLREFAVVITSVLLAGRSSSSFAA